MPSIDPEPGDITRPSHTTASHLTSPLSRDTTSRSYTPSSQVPPGPPSLGYSLYAKHRRRNIFIFWSLVAFDSVAMPIILYFVLWYHTSLSPNAVFSIVTAAVGGVSIVDYGWRLWKLVKRDSNCRVRDTGRYHVSTSYSPSSPQPASSVKAASNPQLDFFHWCFTLMWMILMIELIVGTVPVNPPIRLLSMPLASALFTFSVILMLIDLLRFFGIASPVRISSQPKGMIPKPAIYFILEDVVAVDGCGTVAFRDALSVRYDSSHVFREMIRRLSVFWWVSGLAMAVVTTILIFTLPKEAAFVVGWSVPIVWAAVWALVTTMYVRRELKREETTWSKADAAVYQVA